jgi:predicted nuclease of predicted toxin-antitoxin system
MRFLIDTQLPAALKPLISASGFAVEHVLDLNMGRAKDTAIWDYAEQAGAAIISKDEDFIILKLQRISGPQIVWVRYGNARNSVLLDRFARALPRMMAALSAGEPIIELTT